MKFISKEKFQIKGISSDCIKPLILVHLHTWWPKCDGLDTNWVTDKTSLSSFVQFLTCFAFWATIFCGGVVWSNA